MYRNIVLHLEDAYKQLKKIKSIFYILFPNLINFYIQVDLSLKFHRNHIYNFQDYHQLFLFQKILQKLKFLEVDKKLFRISDHYFYIHLNNFLNI